MAAVDWIKMALVYIRLVKKAIGICVKEAKKSPTLNVVPKCRL